MYIIQNIPDYVINIIERIEKSDHTAYLVGGCVRDSILNKVPTDWDITTDALPRELTDIFPHAIPTGLKHGTISVPAPDKKFVEVTTFRIDGKYSDSRHPENVSFSEKLSDDLSRRDFAINAMAYSLKDGLIDMSGGIKDIDGKVIKCVGNPSERFSEDALRMMRAVRFCAQLDFCLDDSILTSIPPLSYLLKNISTERIRDEFSKTIMSHNPDKIYLFRKLHMSKIFLPELDFLTENEFYAISCDLNKINSSLPSRMAYLLYKSNIENPRQILFRMKYDNKTIKKIISVTACLKSDIPESAYDVRLLMSNKNLKPGLHESFLIKSAFNSGMELKNALSNFNRTIKNGDCTDISMLALDGNDLDHLGIKNGIKKGTVLKQLLNEVLIDPSLNTREKLIHIVSEIR